MDRFSSPSTTAWFERRTIYAAPSTVGDLAALKSRLGVSVGVCLPALDEEQTVGTICSTIRSTLVPSGLVDQLVVIDSGSIDATASVARAGGATVFKAIDLVPEAGSNDKGGKGESLWKSLAVMHTDIVVWLDSDTRNFGPHFVTALVEPLLRDDDLIFTKAFYERPLDGGSQLLPMGGARVTEIAVRPLINLLCPELAGFIQPLSGEFAGRRAELSTIPFATGYDVDLMMLIELVERFGIDRLAQVDLGSRVHRNRDIPALGRMSFEIVRTMLSKLEESGRLKLADQLPDTLVQFSEAEGSRLIEASTSKARVRPPMDSVRGS